MERRESGCGGRRGLETVARVTLAVVVLAGGVAFGHAGEAHVEEGGVAARPALTWVFEPGTTWPLVIATLWYVVGVAKLWGRSGIGRGITVWEAGSYAGGTLALVIALLSPLHPWGAYLFSAHMTQHEILMLVAAPLLVLGKPVAAMLYALPPNAARTLVGATGHPAWLATWRTVTRPLTAFVVHLVLLWAWHLPSLMDATLENEAVHAVQHLCFLGSALLFWWALVHGRRTAANYGVGILYLFTTALHSGLLGALITFAGRPIYRHYLGTTGAYGLTPLEDQQIGGLIMWIPACSLYIVGGLALMAAWLRQAENRTRRREEIHAIATSPATGNLSS